MYQKLSTRGAKFLNRSGACDRTDQRCWVIYCSARQALPRESSDLFIIQYLGSGKKKIYMYTGRATAPIRAVGSFAVVLGRRCRANPQIYLSFNT